MNETIDTVTWTANNQDSYLADSVFEDFSILSKVPVLAGSETSKVIYWKVTQTCVEGEWKWTALPSEPQASDVGPAATVTIAKDVYGMLGINNTAVDNLKSDASKIGIGFISLITLGLLF